MGILWIQEQEDNYLVDDFIQPDSQRISPTAKALLHRLKEILLRKKKPMLGYILSNLWIHPAPIADSFCYLSGI